VYFPPIEKKNVRVNRAEAEDDTIDTDLIPQFIVNVNKKFKGGLENVFVHFLHLPARQIAKITDDEWYHIHN
jgi:hypothetical protein